MTKPTNVDSTSPPWAPQTRLVSAVFLLILAIVLVLRLRDLLVPLILALLLAYLLHPVVTRIQCWLRLPRWAAVLLTYILLLLLIGGVVAGTGLAISQQLVGLVQDIGRLSALLPELLQSLAERTYVVGPWTIDMALINLDPILQSLITSIRPALTQAGLVLASVAGATASTIGLLVIAMVIGFYLLLEAGSLGGGFIELVPPAYRQDFQALMDQTGLVWQAFLRGQLILGLAVGLLVTVVLSALGLRFSLVLGLIAGLLEFVPMFGPAIAGAAAVVVALLQGAANWWGLAPVGFAAVVLVAFMIIQQVENNILVPRIIGRTLNLHPLTVLLGILAGGILAGLLGVLLAAPTLATLRLWLGYVYRKTAGLESMPPPVTEPALLDPGFGLGRRLTEGLKSVRQRLRSGRGRKG
ncbi:MAG TPA: AI-2E family transporter [Anaerolineales bacterium]|nr:AI-2E family transporter [Anaerolineales bacterium]